MYTQIFFVTSVRGMVLPPQMAAKASLSFFGAKMPTPFFFMALSTALVAFVTVVFVVVTLVVVALVVVVMVIEGCKCTDDQGHDHEDDGYEGD